MSAEEQTIPVATPETVAAPAEQPVKEEAPAGPVNTTFVTPRDNHTVIFKPFATGYDKEAIEAVFYQQGEYDLPPMARANRVTLERMIISVDGNKENVVDAVLKMHNQDYDAVIDAMNKVTNPVDEEKKSD